MATQKIYDLAVVTGTYSDGNGGTKNRYQQVGAIMQKDDGGKFIMLERWFNPAGVPNPDNRSNVLLSMFPPKDANGNTTQPQAQRQAQPPKTQGRPAPQEKDDDIPF